MAKSKVLSRSTAKPDNCSGGDEGSGNNSHDGSSTMLPTVRPRTASGERGILRRLRFPRIFGFGHNIEGNVNAGAGASLRLSRKARGVFRTSSVQTTGTESDLLADTVQPPLPPPLPTTAFTPNSLGEVEEQAPQTLGLTNYTRTNEHADVHSNRYSILSRRSSAPDIAEVARRLSRYSASIGLAPEKPANEQHPRRNFAQYGMAAQADSLSNSQEYTIAASDAELEDPEPECPSDDRCLADLLMPKPSGSAGTSSSGSATDDHAKALDNSYISNLYNDAGTSSHRTQQPAKGSQTPPYTEPNGTYSSSSSTNAEGDIKSHVAEDTNVQIRAYMQNGHRNGSSSSSSSSSKDNSVWGNDSSTRDGAIGSGAGAITEIPSNLARVRSSSQSQAHNARTQANRHGPDSSSNAESKLMLNLPPHFQKNIGSPKRASATGAAASDAAASVAQATAALMGSVKARGEKKHTIQSHGVEAGVGKQASVALAFQQQHSLVSAYNKAVPSQSISPFESPQLLPLPTDQSPIRYSHKHRYSNPAPTVPISAANEQSTESTPSSSHACLATERLDLTERRGHRSLSAHTRPKSLYERSESKHPSSSSSSSIAAAKAFLTMISSSSDYDSTNSHSSAYGLTVVTKASQKHFSSSASNSPQLTPYSAPPLNSKMDHRLARLRDAGAASDEKDGDNPSSPNVASSRSLRARSKFATVGIRRASTYVWNRSSVFMRTLSSADELTNYQQQQSPGSLDTGDGDTASAKPVDTAGAPDSKIALCDMPSALPTQLVKKMTPAAMRLHAARELVITEKNFVDNMFVIKKVWMEPVFSSANSPKPIIPYQTARVIFFGISELHAHASQFYREMDFALGNFERSPSSHRASDYDDGMRIGALFRTSNRHWNDFISYVRNYGTAINCLNQLQEYKPYLRYHEECMSQKRTNRQSLKDLLMLPIQRITRYTLLLKNILKHTPAVHGDHIELCRAVKNVTHFASIVNESRRKQEEMYRLIAIFRTIELCPPLPHSDSRSFITEFVVRELISRQPTRLLLFSDMLIVTQAPANTKMDATGHVEIAVEWTYHGSAFLDHVEIQNSDESTNTLITILSLNRTSAALGRAHASRRSHPTNATESSTKGNSSGSTSAHDITAAGHTANTADGNNATESLHSSSIGSISLSSSSYIHDISMSTEFSFHSIGGVNRKKSRKGILNATSRDSIPDSVAVLPHSAFSSPVPSPAQPDRVQSRFNRSSSNSAADVQADSSQHNTPLQRPKTASGYTGSPMNTNPVFSELAVPPLPQALEAPGELGKAPQLPDFGANVAPPKPAQLTLVMQHATSVARKQFVRALKDAAKSHMLKHGYSSEADSIRDASSSDVLSLHPL